MKIQFSISFKRRIITTSTTTVDIWVLGDLLENLAVNLIPKLRILDSQANDRTDFFKFRECRFAFMANRRSVIMFRGVFEVLFTVLGKRNISIITVETWNKYS